MFHEDISKTLFLLIICIANNNLNNFKDDFLNI